MDGHDLLSAALDECGLGDLFSSDPAIQDPLDIISPYVDEGQGSIDNQQYEQQQLSQQTDIAALAAEESGLSAFFEQLPPQQPSHEQLESQPLSEITPQQDDDDFISSISSFVEVPMQTAEEQAESVVVPPPTPPPPQTTVTAQTTVVPAAVVQQQPAAAQPIKKIKKIIIRKIAANGTETTQNVLLTAKNGNFITANGTSAVITSSTNGRPNIITLKSVTANGVNGSATTGRILTSGNIKKIITIPKSQIGKILPATPTVQPVSRPIQMKASPANHVILSTAATSSSSATSTTATILPIATNTVTVATATAAVNSAVNSIATVALAAPSSVVTTTSTTVTAASGQVLTLANGKVLQLKPGSLQTIFSSSNIANGTINGNRVITVKTIRAPVNHVALVNAQRQQQASLSAPASPISPAVISPPTTIMSATNGFAINPSIQQRQPQQFFLRTPQSAPPTVTLQSPLPRVNPKPVVRVSKPKPTSSSLLGNTKSSTLGPGRRISAKTMSNSNSQPGSPANGRQSKPGTPGVLDAKSQEDQVDQAIMLEEVRRLLEDQEEEEFANLETFADYMPAKLKFGSRHPDLIVETASLSSIPPPDVYYRLAIPDEVIDEGRLSALQLESIIYASQQHETILPDGCRAGFLIGDGAGVGKGRTVAGIIYENYLRGRKRSLWFSVSTDLKYDAERDLYDIGAPKIEVHMLNKFKYGFKIHSPENDNVKRGVIFATYSSLIGESTTISGKYSTRFNQIVQWCGEDFDGCIIFDECHKAKNLFPSGTNRASKTGQMVLELQKRLPKARVVYASATGATEPKNMGYMTRLGIWGKGTPFEDFATFVQTVEKRGVGAMELVAIDLKMRGMYVARQLSFKGVSFRIEHVPLSREFIRIYNCCCRLWVSAKAKFEKALDLMGADTQVAKAVWTQFWGAHQRFFKYLCIASKVKFAVAFVKEALRCNKSIVIGLQSTGEARTMEVLEDSGGELNDFVSTAKSVFQSLIEKHFPAPNRKKLAKLLGNDTSFFDSLGIKLSRNANDEIVVSSFEQGEEEQQQEQRLRKAKNFFDSENESDDDFVSVSEGEDDDIFGGGGGEKKADENGEDSSDIDSDDLDDIDDIMDEKLGLKRKRGGGGGGASNALKFMDILLGPSSAAAKKRKPKKRSKAAKRPKMSKGPKKSMRNKYEKFYEGFDKVGDDVGGYCERLRDELLQQLESFGERLPPNTLDELIDELGGPENVAEMTGRKGRVVSTEDGQVQYEARTDNDVSLEMLNLVEKQRFMDDDKRVAIISEAASSGISLHADRRAKNRWRRVHITVELPWSADRAIQQFGRTHRSNQVSAPEYVFLISNLAGEKRFASIVAKRLESLGALTHGDRRATESRDLSQFNIDTKYGRQALEIVMKTIAKHYDVKPLVSEPERYSGDFFEDCREGLAGVGLMTICRRTGVVSLDKDYANINKFLNRILGLEVELQNTLFRYFNDTMDAVIKQAKRSGKYDSGIIDLSNDVGNVENLEEESFILRSSSGATKIQLHSVSIDRGLNYDRAYNMYQQAVEEDDYFKNDIGFYTSDSPHQTRKIIFLAIPESSNKNQNDVKQIFRIYKPSLGLQSKYETKSSLHERGQKVEDLMVAQKLWTEHYDLSDTRCTHQLLFGRCRGRTNPDLQPNGAASTPSPNMKPQCDVGLRKRTYCILSGSVLTVWPEVEKQIPYIQNHKLQIVRLKTADGRKFIGPMVPQVFVNEVRNCLQKLSSPNAP